MKKKPIIATATYSTRETAELLGMNKDVISRYLTEGRIKSIILGNKRRILGENILEYLRGK